MRQQKRLFFYVCFSLAYLMGTVGCSKKDESSTVRISVPSFASPATSTNSLRAYSEDEVSRMAGTATDANMTRLMVNISGPGLASPILVVWDRGESGGVAAKSYEFIIPRGDSRLVQVLAVFQSSAGMVFAYGDTISSFQATSVELNITLNFLGATSGTGGIAGRYLRADGSGPTGIVNMMLQIPERPAMKVSSDSIYGGWFSFFAIQDKPFRFELADTKEIIFPAYDAAQAEAQVPGDSRSMIVSVPGYYRSRYGGDPPYEFNEKQKLAFGFFGPGSSATQKIYYSNQVINTSGFFQDQNLSVPLQWNGAGAPSANQVGVLSGGLGNATPSLVCKGTNAIGSNREFVDCINFIATKPDIHGGGLPFTGPWAATATGRLMSMSVGASALSMTFASLPGSGIDAVGVFIRPSVVAYNDNDVRNDGGYMCNRLTSYGFTKIKDAAVNVSSTSRTINVLSVTAAEINATGLSATSVLSQLSISGSAMAQVFLCPRAVGASTYLPYALSNSRDGGSGSNELRLKVTGSDLNLSNIMQKPPLDSISAYTFVKNDIGNSYHRFFPVVYSTYSTSFLQAGEIDSVKIYLFDGSTWSAGTLLTPTTSAVYSGEPSPANLVLSGSQLSAVAGWSTATKFKLEFTVSAAAATTYGLDNPTLTTPEYGLVMGCTGLSLYYTDGTAAPVNAVFFTNFNNSDITKNYRLQYTTGAGCSTASVIIDYISFTGSGPTNPPNCFEVGRDMYTSPTSPFEFQISPTDAADGTCQMPTTTSIAARFPGLSGNVVTNTATNPSISHSTTTAKFEPFLMPANFVATTSGDLRLRVTKLVQSAQTNHAVSMIALNTNSDGRITSHNSVGGVADSTISEWSTTRTDYVSTPTLPSTTGTITFTPPTTVPTNNKLAAVNLIGGPQASSFLHMVNSATNSQNIVDASSDSFAGGSVILVGDDGTNLHPRFFPVGPAGSLDKNFVDLSPPVASPVPNNTPYRAVYVINGGGGNAARFVMIYGSIIRAGAYDYSTGATSWSAPAALPYPALGSVKTMNGSSEVINAVLDTGSAYKVYSITPPNYLGGGSFGTFGGLGSMVSDVTSPLGGYATVPKAFLSCGNELLLLGINSTNLSIVSINANGTLATVFSGMGNLLSTGYDRFACSPITTTFGQYRGILAWSSSLGANTLTPRIHLFTSGFSADSCTGSPGNQNINPVSGPAAGLSEGFLAGVPLKGAVGLSGNTPGFLVSYVGTSSTTTRLDFVPISCVSTTLTIGTSLNYGGITNNQVTGLSLNNSGFNLSKPLINIFGTSGLFIEAEPR